MNPGERPRSGSVLWNEVVCCRSPVSSIGQKHRVVVTLDRDLIFIPHPRN